MTVRELIGELMRVSDGNIDMPVAFDLNGEYHASTLPYARNRPADRTNTGWQVAIRVGDKHFDGNPIEVDWRDVGPNEPTGRQFIVVEIG